MNANDVIQNYYQILSDTQKKNHELWSELYDTKQELEQLRNTHQTTSYWSGFMSYMAKGQGQRTLPEIFEDFLQKTLQEATNRETYKDRCREIRDEAKTAVLHFPDRPDELVNALQAIIGTCDWVLQTK